MSSVTVLSFRVSHLDYALDIGAVVEVTGSRALTRVPGTPGCLAGLTSWRGRTIPVLDLGALLKGDAPQPDVDSRLIIVGRPEPFGLRVDQPGRILRDCTAVESRESVAPRGVSLIEGESGLVRLLDPVWLLNQSREAFTELST